MRTISIENPIKYYVYEIKDHTNAKMTYDGREARRMRDRLNKSAGFEKYAIQTYAPYWGTTGDEKEALKDYKY